MGDTTGMLTATGVIATLISVFFASAALYVQAKKRSQNERADSEGTSEYPEPPMPPAYVDPIPEEEDDSDQQDVRQTTDETTQDSTSSPLFRRYTCGGAEIPFPRNGESADDGEYRWE